MLPKLAPAPPLPCASLPLTPFCCCTQLSLLAHEPHFALLREVVTFGGPRGHKSKADKAGPKKESFQLLYVAVLREYFDKEFSAAFKVGDRDLFFLLTFLMENDALCQDWLGTGHT